MAEPWATGTTTLSNALRACALIGPTALQQGKEIHAMITNQADSLDALLTMYIACGERQQVALLWEQMSNKLLTTKVCSVFLNTCANIGVTALGLGKQVYITCLDKGLVLLEGFDINLYLQAFQLTKYCSCPGLTCTASAGICKPVTLNLSTFMER